MVIIDLKFRKSCIQQDLRKEGGEFVTFSWSNYFRNGSRIARNSSQNEIQNVDA